MNDFCVLVVDDEPRIIKFLQVRLKASGYNVITAGSGLEALEQLQAQEPSLVVLDVTMPGMDGFETLRQLRAISSVPVIILSGRESNNDKVKGLGLGADDYMVKPFSPDELVARIEAVRRRLGNDQDRKTVDSVTLGNLNIDLKNHIVTVKGVETRLARIEWLLLSELVRNSGRLMMYGELLSKIWGPEYRDDIQILRTWVSRLRHKIEPDSNQTPLIRTIPKTGYMIDQALE